MLPRHVVEALPEVLKGMRPLIDEKLIRSVVGLHKSWESSKIRILIAFLEKSQSKSVPGEWLRRRLLQERWQYNGIRIQSKESITTFF